MDDHASGQPHVSETLPETYRLVLDRIAALDTAGHRREADLVRTDAIMAYSRRWNDRTARRLDRLVTRAERVLDGRERPRQRARSRRSEALRWLTFVPARTRRRIADARAGRAGHPGVPAERPTA